MYLRILFLASIVLTTGTIQMTTAQDGYSQQNSDPKEEWCSGHSRLFRHGPREDMETPLLQAVVKGEATQVRALIADRADVNKADKVGITPLLLASEYGDVEIMKLLIQAGANVNFLSKRDRTALMGAVRCSAGVKLLLEAGATVELRNQSNETALMHAASGRNLESVKLILAANADISARNLDNRTPLIFSINGGNPRVVEYLLQNGAAKELATDVGSGTALIEATKYSKSAIVRILIAAGANAKAMGNYGHTPLAVAAMNGDLESAHLLLAAGADPNVKAKESPTPITWASTYGHTRVVQALLKAGAAVYNKDDSWPALVAAARGDHTETMDVLLKAGADINMRAYDGRTALMYSARQGKIKSVRFLIERGAELNLKDENGTALSAAKKSTQIIDKAIQSEIIQILQRAGAVE